MQEIPLGGLGCPELCLFGIRELAKLPIRAEYLDISEPMRGLHSGTVMGWLSDTTAGGATTFFVNDSPLLLWPSKGAAAFWFGLFSDGTRDSKVIHGGCPVIAGQTGTLEVRDFVASWQKDTDINGKNPSYLGPGVDQSGAGSKWIVNKWIQTFDQFSKFPCSRERRVRVKPWDKSTTYW